MNPINKIIFLALGLLAVFLPQFWQKSLLFILVGLFLGGLVLYNIRGFEKKGWILCFMVLGILGIYRSIVFFIISSTKAVN